MTMWLDFARCADWDETCPEKCWRAQLTGNTARYEPPPDAVFTYAHFAGSPGCVKPRRKEAPESDAGA